MYLASLAVVLFVGEAKSCLANQSTPVFTRAHALCDTSKIPISHREALPPTKVAALWSLVTTYLLLPHSTQSQLARRYHNRSRWSDFAPKSP